MASSRCLSFRLVRCGALGVALLQLPPLLAATPSSAAQERSGKDDASWVLDRIEVTGQRDSLRAPLSVTATRTTTPVERVPQSIQILTRTLLEEQELQTASDALVNVSGVVPSRTMETVLQSPLIRGFGVNYFIDGLPTYGLPATVADPATLVNVERIEVAKGPTSTLYGGGSGAPLSGLLNLVSRDPQPEFGGSFAVRGGRFGTLGTDFDVSLPGDRVALRVTGMAENADSHIDVVDSRRRALFPTLTWQLSESTQLLLRGHFNRLAQREYAGLPAELTVTPALVIDRNHFAGAEDAPRTEVDNRIGSATLTHDLTTDSRLEFSLRRFHSRFDEYATFPLLPLAGTLYAFGSGYVPSKVEQTFATTSWLRTFDVGGSRHQLLVGVDSDRTDYFGALGLDFEWGLIDYADSRSNAPFGTPPALTDLQNDDLRTLALYAQDQVRIGERLDLIAGLRWTRLDLRSSYTSGGFPFANSDDRYDKLTPRLGASWVLAEGISLFAGHARGFQGVVAAIGVSEPDPESSVSNEVGIKFAEPLNGLTGTLAFYQIKRRNVITSDPDNVGLSIQSGEQRARGLETDLAYEPSAALSLLLSYAYTDAEVTRDNRLPVGDRLRRVPEHAGRLAGRWRFSEGIMAGLEIGAGVSIVSARELTLPNTSSVPGRALWDAQASYDFRRVTLSLAVQNLQDKKGFEPYQYLGGAYVVPTVPRSAFVTVRLHF